jgi:MFS family permease
MSEGIRHRGWIVVSGALVVFMLGYGSLYSFGAFFSDLSRDFHANRADTSLVFALAACMTLSLGALSGPIADRLGPRVTVGFGSLLCAAGLWFAGSAHSLTQIYAAYIGVGIGIGCVYVPSIGAVQRWFVRRRAFASGIAVSGIGVGTLVLPPLAAFLIESHGWRAAYRVFALAMLAAGLIGVLCIEHSPERRAALVRRRSPVGPGPVSGPISAQAAGATLGQALRTRPFWLLYVASFAASFGLYIPFVHLAPYAVDHGLPKTFGVTLVGLIGVGSVCGRLLLGSTADRMGRRTSLAATFVGMILTILLWLGGPYPVLLVCFALVFGVFYGGFVALLPSVVMDYFGGRNVSAIIGALYTSAGVGTLFGPTFAGYAFDVTGSYTAPILAAALANALAAVCVFFMADPHLVQTWATSSELGQPAGASRPS